MTTAVTLQPGTVSQSDRRTRVGNIPPGRCRVRCPQRDARRQRTPVHQLAAKDLFRKGNGKRPRQAHPFAPPPPDDAGLWKALHKKGKVEACNRRIKQELIAQQPFANLHEARGAIKRWVDHFNYRRAHQGIGGFLVPAKRFHGQAKAALSAMDKGVDITGRDAISSMIERSVINIVLTPEGRLTLYLIGQPIDLGGR
jgi:hypothetical protein